MCRLRFLEVYIDLGFAAMRDCNLKSVIRSLCISLTSPATLEHLKFNIRFRCNIYHFDPNACYEDLRHADVWRHLDSITTLTTGSRLRRVDININYAFRYHSGKEKEFDKYKVEKAVFDGLPLLHTKGILFVEVVGG
jgi:hypothetical protein